LKKSTTVKKQSTSLLSKKEQILGLLKGYLPFGKYPNIKEWHLCFMQGCNKPAINSVAVSTYVNGPVWHLCYCEEHENPYLVSTVDGPKWKSYGKPLAYAR
jgi:hypothetical protein